MSLGEGFENLGLQKSVRCFFVHNRCWTADMLAKRGLPHPDQCPLRDQVEETINFSLLVSFVVARQVWFNLSVPSTWSGGRDN
jgi:hypothetical protein